MNKGKKFVLISLLLIGVGIVLCGIGISLGGIVTGIHVGDRGITVQTPDTETISSRTYQAGEEDLASFHSIVLEANYSDVSIIPGEDYGIAYKVDEKDDFTYEIVDGTLKVVQKCPATRVVSYGTFSIGNINISNESMTTDYSLIEEEFITITVPESSSFTKVNLVTESGNVICKQFGTDELSVKAEYGQITVEDVKSKKAELLANSGDLSLSSFADGELIIKDEYGNVFLQDIESADMVLQVNSGNIQLENVIADSISLEDEYGNLSINQIQTGAFKVTAESGNVVLKDAKTEDCSVFSEYGAIDIDTLSAGTTQIKANSGNITLSEVNATNMLVTSEYGHFDGNEVKTQSFEGELSSGNCNISGFSVDDVKINCEYGNVTLAFVEKYTDYQYDIKTEYGKIEIDHQDMGETYKSLEKKDKTITIFCESGDVIIDVDK